LVTFKSYRELLVAGSEEIFGPSMKNVIFLLKQGESLLLKDWSGRDYTMHIALRGLAYPILYRKSKTLPQLLKVTDSLEKRPIHRACA